MQHVAASERAKFSCQREQSAVYDCFKPPSFVMNDNSTQITVTDSRCRHIFMMLQYQEGERDYSLPGVTVVAVNFNIH